MTKKPMETICDLIEEAKLRTVWWALFIFAVSYFLTHTSKSMWMNIPMSILFACALRFLLNEVDFRWKVRMSWPQTYLSHLERKQLSVNDPRLSTTPDPPRWKKKIDSPVVEAAVSDFVDKILKDFVVDLWLSEITPDMETAEHIRTIIMEAIGEVAGRATQLNLVDLLTKDVVDLIGDHIELFRRNQAVIGVDVMKTLSSEERDERLKHHLMASKELHPALLSAESEHKVLQRLMSGVVAAVLRPQETQIPIVRSIAREILSCLVMQPVMNLASPGYINELIETLLLTINEESSGLGKVAASCGPFAASKTGESSSAKGNLSFGRECELPLANINHAGTQSYQITPTEESMKTKPADWALMLEVATKRRTEVLMPENLENMWAKGRNYKKKEKKYFHKPLPDPLVKGSLQDLLPEGNLGERISTNRFEKTAIKEKNFRFLSAEESTFCGRLSDENSNRSEWKLDSNTGPFLEGEHLVGELDGAKNGAHCKNRLKRSNSTSDLSIQSHKAEMPIISNFYSPEFERYGERLSGECSSDIIIKKEVQLVPKLRCRVMGAYFEKLGSKSFAVYSIAVTAAENRTWFVKRRYSNFERLHRHLKDIPNYTLHLPPKRIFSSSTEDTFVHQRCIQLDKYLQDLLSIANVAEQHEVWDFLSASSKSYSFGKSSSVMRTLAVNVDDAVDDIMRQVKGVSGGLMRKVAGTTSPGSEGSVYSSTSVCNAAEEDKSISRQLTADNANNFSDEGSEKDMNRINEELDGSQPIGWHSDNELNSTNFPKLVMKLGVGHKSSGNIVEVNTKTTNQSDLPANFALCSGPDDPTGMPPEWSPPKLSVPVLNLVDNVFQLKRRGWLRRQVFWISKQILQLVMEDAIDDWLLRQINWLRREDVIAQGIRWLQDVLWPGGTFFTKIGTMQARVGAYVDEQKPFQMINQCGNVKLSDPGSFEQQLEAARRASDLKKLLFDGAPTTLVSLIGAKQYRRCARDIYYFSQSTVCMKQLAYAILELILASVFPELRSLIWDVHGKKHVHQPV